MNRYHFLKFARLPYKEKLLFFEALFTQHAVWLVLQIVPFKWVSKIFPNPENPNSDPDKNKLEQIRQATRYASTLSFWKNRCLVQSLAARRMLTRRSITSRLTLGVMHDGQKKMLAHAWLTAGDVEVVAKTREYRELYSF